MAYWDYWIQYSPNDKFPTPYVNLACLQPDLKLFRDSGVEMMFVECERVETTSFFALKRWVGLKLMQDPDRAVSGLVDTFMRGYYGPAAKAMRTYLTYLEHQIASVPATVKLSATKAEERPYLDLPFFVRCERLLDEAEAVCAARTPELLHVRRERVPVDGALCWMWGKLEKSLPQGRTMPFDREAVLARYENSRLEQMQAMRSPDKIDKGKADLAEEMRKIREVSQIERRQAEPPPQLRVPRLETAGDPDDLKTVDWTRAARIEEWRTIRGGDAPGRKLKASLAHNGTFLIVLLEEELDPSKLIATADIWSGDDWELFFMAEPGKAPCRQLGINPEGKSAAYEWKVNLTNGGKAEVWDSQALLKSERDGGWRVFARLPLAALIPDGVKPGQTFFMNIYRATRRPGEPMAWSPPFADSFHELSRAARVTLEP